MPEIRNITQTGNSSGFATKLLMIQNRALCASTNRSG